MIPYAASDTDDAESIVPWSNLALIALNFVVFFYELAVGATGGDDALSNLVQQFGLVPCEYTARCSIAAGTPAPLWITAFTSMFLHAGWSHILGNMVYLSRVALPGISVSLALHHQPIFGAVAALLVGAFLVGWLEDKARAATEAIIGVIFSAALAMGSLTTSGEDLIDALFGGGGSPAPAGLTLRCGTGVLRDWSPAPVC